MTGNCETARSDHALKSYQANQTNPIQGIMEQNAKPFEIGDKIICIDNSTDHPMRIAFHRFWVVEGANYTVRKCIKNLMGQWVVYIEGIPL
jgi:hypothetical protein